MNPVSALFGRRVRGIRVIDMAGTACLAVIVLIVYASKAGGGVEAAKIADTLRLIAAEEQQIRLLKAEDAYLTQPRRLRDLSRAYLQMGPVAADHDTTLADLQRRRDEPPARVLAGSVAPATVSGASARVASAPVASRTTAVSPPPEPLR